MVRFVRRGCWCRMTWYDCAQTHMSKSSLAHNWLVGTYWWGVFGLESELGSRLGWVEVAVEVEVEIESGGGSEGGSEGGGEGKGERKGKSESGSEQ